MKYLIITMILLSMASCAVVEVVDPCYGKRFISKQWCEFKNR